MKSKKSLVQLVLLIMSFVLIFSSTACRSTETPPTEQPAVTAPEVEQPEKKPYKIGIMTGTVSQGEEEYQEAMNQIAKYGDMIVHATYPDNFSTETETTISQVVQMASDPDVKAIVFVQAIPGAAAASSGSDPATAGSGPWRSGRRSGRAAASHHSAVRIDRRRPGSGSNCPARPGGSNCREPARSPR